MNSLESCDDIPLIFNGKPETEESVLFITRTFFEGFLNPTSKEEVKYHWAFNVVFYILLILFSPIIILIMLFANIHYSIRNKILTIAFEREKYFKSKE